MKTIQYNPDKEDGVHRDAAHTHRDAVLDHRGTVLDRRDTFNACLDVFGICGASGPYNVHSDRSSGRTCGAWLLLLSGEGPVVMAEDAYCRPLGGTVGSSCRQQTWHSEHK